MFSHLVLHDGKCFVPALMMMDAVRMPEEFVSHKEILDLNLTTRHGLNLLIPIMGAYFLLFADDMASLADNVATKQRLF